MNQNSQTCMVCGCTESNLVNGFYYCLECGTQDMTIRETVVDNVLADGTVQLFQKKTLTKKKPKVKMTVEWRNWHIYNYILHGLTEELINLGAKPSLKGKVLMLWTKYINKFQNKAQFEKYIRSNNHLLEENFDEEIEEEEEKTTKSHIKVVTLKILFTLLCAALNLDGSHITPTVVIRFIKEGRISFRNYKKYVPVKLSTVEILTMNSSSGNLISTHSLLVLCSRFFKELDLGLPLIPNLKTLVDVYVKELCLPNEFQDLVYSLIYFMPFDVALGAVGPLFQGFPHFEVMVMAYVVIALKMCFGLDDCYDQEVAARVDSLNAKYNHPKLYRKGCKQSTRRLFSFKEWMDYLDFRKYILCKYYQPFATKFRIVSDDCLLTEMLNDRKVNRVLKDGNENRVTHDLINKIPNDTFHFLANAEFPKSLTPLSSYTAHILSQIDDSITRLRLSEDFTKYSLNYACVDLSLHGKKLIGNKGETKEVNLIRGPAAESKKISGCLTRSLFNECVVMKKKTRTEDEKSIIYVKNTKNRDWYLEYKKARYVEYGEFGESDEEILQGLASNTNKRKSNPNARKYNLIPELKKEHANNPERIETQSTSNEQAEEQRLLEALKLNPNQIAIYQNVRTRIEARKENRNLLIRNKFMARKRVQENAEYLEEQRLVEALRIKPELLPMYYQSADSSASQQNDKNEGKSTHPIEFLSKFIKTKRNFGKIEQTNVILNPQNTGDESPPRQYPSHTFQRDMNVQKQINTTLSARRARKKQLIEYEKRMNIISEHFKPVKLELKEIPDLEAGQNIFDDEFEPFVEPQNTTKVEDESVDDCHVFDFTTSKFDDEYEEKPLDDVQWRDSIDLEKLAPRFEPFAFDREKVIRELILRECAKYKIQKPTEYKEYLPKCTARMHAPRERKKMMNSAMPIIKSNDVIKSYFERLQEFSNNLNKTIDVIDQTNVDTTIPVDDDHFDEDIPLGQDLNDDKDVTTIKDPITLDDETVAMDDQSSETDILNDVDLHKIIAKSKIVLESETKKAEILSKLRNVMDKKHANKIADICLQLKPTEPLIEDFPPSFRFNYVTKHYKTHLYSSRNFHLAFREEMLMNFPKSLAFVIETCAVLLETSPFHLYQHVQYIETKFLELNKCAAEFHPNCDDGNEDVNENNMDVDGRLAEVVDEGRQGDPSENISAVNSDDEMCEVFIVIDDSDGDNRC